MTTAICLVIGYLTGCFQTAYITGKLTARIDIREHGSGNAGTTNIIRVLGRRAGMIVFFGDVAKTVLAYSICALLFGGGGSFFGQGDVWPGLVAAVGVIIGHNFPIFLHLKGGKGIASSLGLFLCLDWRAALIVYAVGAVVLIGTRYVSLCGLIMVSLYPLVLFFFGYRAGVIVLCVGIAVLAYIRHTGNISRLCKGNERKISFGTK